MLGPVPRPTISDRNGNLHPPWQSWIGQLGAVVSAGNAAQGKVINLPPAAQSQFARAFVTDANATAFNSIVVGGGANIVPVFCDGTNWRIG